MGAAASGVGSGAKAAGYGVAVGAVSTGIGALVGAIGGKCVSTIIISIGCDQENEFSVSDSKITKIITNNIYKYQTRIDQTDDIVQNQEILLDNSENCSVVINQTADIKIDFNVELNEQIAEQSAIDIQNLLKQSVDSIFDSKNDMFSTITKQTNKANLESAINNEIVNTFNLDNMRNIFNSLYGFQGQKITIKNIKCPQDDSKIIINQEFILDHFSKVMVLSLINNLLNIKAINDTYQEAIAKLKQENKGLNAIIDSLMSFFKTWAIVIGIIIIAVIIGFVMFTKSGGLTQLKDLQEASKYYYF
jgi:hypothetical protein